MYDIKIGLIGDYNPEITAHRAIPLALEHAARSTGTRLAYEWVPTLAVDSPRRLEAFEALWCVPGSPYLSMDGALCAIRHARENGLPFLGTCGGFQHAVIEYARNILGWVDAEHAETAPDAARAVIAPLECALVEVRDSVRLVPGTRIAAAYGTDEIDEGYRCRYGLNAQFQAQLVAGALRAAALAGDNTVRAVELDGHPFFVATLFQPERAALANQPAPLVQALLAACQARQRNTGSMP